MNGDDLALLRFEKLLWRYQGAKAEEIRRRFGLSLTQYHQRLLALCERPEALVAEPALGNRVNRRRRGRLGDGRGTTDCAGVRRTAPG